jgi:hypothetical protein
MTGVSKLKMIDSRNVLGKESNVQFIQKGTTLRQSDSLYDPRNAGDVKLADFFWKSTEQFRAANN